MKRLECGSEMRGRDDRKSVVDVGKYHWTESSANPLEAKSFEVARKMVESPRVRLGVSCYVIFVHFVVLGLFLRLKYCSWRCLLNDIHDPNIL